MKKATTILLVLALCLTMIFGLTACGETKYTVTLNLSGGNVEGNSSAVMLKENQLTKNDIPELTYDGHKFMGWYTTKGYEGKPIELPYTVTNNITLYARWEKLDDYFTVVYFVNSGSEPPKGAYKELLKEPKTTRDNYIFLGWYDSASFAGERLQFPLTIDKDTELFAKWKLEEGFFNFSFVDGDDSEFDTLKPRVAQSIDKLPVVSKEGHKFLYWTYNNKKIEKFPFIPATTDENVKLVATWEIISYTITFFDGDKELQKLTFPYNNKIILPADPTSEQGLIFANWCTDKSLTSEFKLEKMPASNISLYSKWNSQGLEFILINNDTEYALSSVGTCKDIFITLPTEYNGKPVTKILSGAFEGASFVKNILISSSIKEIERNALAGLTGLAEIELPFIGKNASATGKEGLFGYIFSDASKNNLTRIIQRFSDNAQDYLVSYIPSGLAKVKFSKPVVIGEGLVVGDGAFNACSTIKDITFSIIKNGSFGKLAFANMTSLAEFTLPDTITTIGERAFENCFALKRFVIKKTESKLSTIGEYAFANCFVLDSIELPAGVTKINNGVFNNCYKLKTVVTNTSPTEIGEYAFANCVILGDLALNDLTKIGEKAFFNCKNIFSSKIKQQDVEVTGLVNFGSKLEVIGVSAFEGCASIKTVNFDIKSIIKEISSRAFANCNRLESVSIAKSVETIANDVFVGCLRLVNIRNLSLADFGASANFGVPANLGLEVVTTDKEFANKISFDKEKKIYVFEITNDEVINGKYVYGADISLELILDDTFKGIYSYAFAGSSGLKRVVLSKTVSYIGEYAFANCSALTSFTFDKDNIVVKISNGMFEGCSSLASIILPKEITEIGNRAFFGCVSLKSITISSTTCPVLGEKVFYAYDKNNVEVVIDGLMITVPADKLIDYKYADGWKDYRARLVKAK
ncbi:MAG: leucine-rich repeat protein [Clostridia bacterium]